MEPAGLAIGIAGLAGLFSSCLEAIDRVKAYRSFASDSNSLSVQLNAHRIRLERWGRSIGLDSGQLSADHDRRLDNSHTRSVVEDLLTIINSTLRSHGRPHQAGRGYTHLNATLGDANQPRTLDGKLTRVLGGIGNRTVQVTQLEDLVQLLHDLVPPDRVASTRPTSVVGDLEAVRGAGPLGRKARPETQSENVWLANIRQTIAEYRQTLAEMQAETRREVHTWLLGGHFPNERYDESRDKRLPGTCDWILTRPAFARWSAADLPPGSPELLWIHGPPGFGKTVLCTRIVEHLSAVPERTVAHFFFSSDHESRHDPYAAVRSWVSQLASQPEVYALVRQRWETTHDLVATRATVIQLLHDVLQARPSCYLVVDGLDECTAPADGTSSVARFLEDVKNAMTLATRLVVVSRDETEIRQPLRAGDPARLAEYQISPEDVSADAAAYARDIADRNLPSKDEDVRASLSRAMADRCEGQFLWLKMQEPTLKTSKNVGQLQRALDGVPTGLDRVYERLWEKITRSGRRDRAIALLRWSAFALRPLTINEITEAVLIDEDREDLPVDELPDIVDDDYIHSEILEVCGPLLDVRGLDTDSAGKQTLHLAHFTIRQFLVGRLPVGGILANETLQASNEQMQNTLLARSCLWYVQSRHTWRDGASTDGSPFRAALRDYSAASWHAHVKSGVSLDGDPCTLERIRTFMNDAHPCWKPWRTWFDEQDDEESKQAEDEDIPPGPSYYALKLDLSVVAISHIREFGPGPLVACGRSVLDLCCLRGNIEAAEAILDAGVDVETRGSMGGTPLYTASQNGWAEMARLLLHRGAQIDVPNHDGRTPVLAAAANGHLEVVKILMDRGADITVASNDGRTPVFAAAANGHLEVVRILLYTGADFLMADKDGRTPVFAAAANGHLEVVKILLYKGADITVASNDGRTPVFAAATNGHLEVVKILLEKGAEVNAQGGDCGSALQAASSRGHVEIVKLLLEEGADVNAQGGYYGSALQAASSEGHIEIVKLLLEKGADINAQGGYYGSALQAASSRGHVEIVKLLLEEGADVQLPEHVVAVEAEDHPDRLASQHELARANLAEGRAKQTILLIPVQQPDLGDGDVSKDCATEDPPETWEYDYPYPYTLTEHIDNFLAMLDCSWLTLPISKGMTRVSWHCGCGTRHHDDYPEGSTLTQQASDFIPQSDATIWSGQQGHSKHTPSSFFSFLERAAAGIANAFGKQKSSANQDKELGEVAPVSTTLQTEPPDEEEGSQRLKLLLCIDRGRLHTQLHQVTLVGVSDDKRLFQFLRNTYYTERQISRFALWSLSSLSLTRFEVDHNNYADIHYHGKELCENECICIPDKTRAETEYSCEPAPAKDPESKPVISSRKLTYYFTDPKCLKKMQNSTLKQLPKLKDELRTYSSGTTVGWGIHFKEDWHWKTLGLFMAVLLTLSLIFGITWCICTGDVSSAFAVTAAGFTLVSVIMGGFALASQF